MDTLKVLHSYGTARTDCFTIKDNLVNILTLLKSEKRS